MSGRTRKGRIGNYGRQLEQDELAGSHTCISFAVLLQVQHEVLQGVEVNSRQLLGNSAKGVTALCRVQVQA